MDLDCVGCDTYQSMEGGPVQDEQGNFPKAKFLCPQCGTLNVIKWGFDF